MDDKQLIEFNALGFIPGPFETDEDFLKRVNYCLNLKEDWPDIISYSQKFKTIGELPSHGLKKTKQLFDIYPTWIPVFFTNHQLMPWHGGSAWIFQQDENSEVASFFQLRKVFEKKNKFLGVYDRDELIAHEVCHACRMMFEEPKFEELIAYRTSNSSFRRYFGSIVQSSIESMMFILSIFLIFLTDVFLIASGYNEAYQSFFILKLIPISLITFGLMRLWVRQQTFKKALNQLKMVARHKEDAEAIIYRLQDKEIELFSKLKPDEILNYLDKEKDKSLRFRLIHLAYIQ